MLISTIVFMYLQVQHEGLQTAYIEDAATNTLIKKFLALPMLPAEHIPPVFESLSDEVVTEPKEKLAAYIKKQWMDTRHFPPPAAGVHSTLLPEATTTWRGGTTGSTVGGSKVTILSNFIRT